MTRDRSTGVWRSGVGHADCGAATELLDEGADALGEVLLVPAPLFQTSFFPDLIHVYLTPADVLVWPSFLQVVPGFPAAVAGERLSVRTRHPITMVANTRFIRSRLAKRQQREQRFHCVN